MIAPLPLGLIDYVQALILGLLQGFSELFPISSLGHSVVLPRLLGWQIHQKDDFFLTFLVATHLATAVVLLVFFGRDWLRILRGLGRSLRDREIGPGDTDARLGWLLVVGTIPAGILGLALESSLRDVFGTPRAAAAFLALNGVMLFAAEALRRRATPDAQATPGASGSGEPPDGDTRVARRVGFRGAVGIGAAQAIALLPGFSRSGATMGGGLLAGLSHQDAARFAFLLATPIIFAAAALKLPDLFGHKGDGVRGPAALGAVASALTAYLSVRFLMRFFQTNRLTPMAWYCLVIGVVLSIVFVLD